MSSGSGAVRLNQYQQLMRRMSETSAYNAMHMLAVDIDEAMQPRLLNAIKTVVAQLGLGIPQFSSDNQYVTFTPCLEQIFLETHAIALQAHAESEMNYFFEYTEFPLRFFLISHQSQHYFCITYNHWIGDGYSILRLAEAILGYFDRQLDDSLTLNAPSIEASFKHIYQKKMAYYRYWGVVQSFFCFSRAFRTKVKNEVCTETGCDIHFFEQDVFEQLTKFCNTRHITFNDLFIAILAQVFGRITHEERRTLRSKYLKPRRDRIVIGVIANIRAPSRISLRAIFGLFLGFFYLSFKAPERSSLDELVKTVHSQTKRIKRNYTAVKQFLLFKIQTMMWDKRKDKQRQYRLFSKNIPITVGISNMNLNQCEDVLANAVNLYLRCSPSGMVCPIVFSLTTFKGYLSLVINFRQACYSSFEVEKIKHEFVKKLSQLEAC